MNKVTPENIPFTQKEINTVIEDFYTRIQKDPSLSIPFKSVHNWPEHIDRLTHFWWIRFGGEPYLEVTYNPIEKHYLAGFNEDLLKQWLKLFHATLKDHLSPQQCSLWEDLSSRMGSSLLQRNDALKKRLNLSTN